MWNQALIAVDMQQAVDLQGHQVIAYETEDNEAYLIEANGRKSWLKMRKIKKILLHLDDESSILSTVLEKTAKKKLGQVCNTLGVNPNTL